MLSSCASLGCSRPEAFTDSEIAELKLNGNHKMGFTVLILMILDLIINYSEAEPT